MYENGKIYRIVGNVQNSKCYIGSTVQPLSKRMGGHRALYRSFQNGIGNKCMSYELFDEYGIDTCEIVLIENFPCETKDELHKRERYWIETMECVNKVVPTRTKKEYDKEYRKENREYIAEYKKEYRQENKEVIADYQKEYYEKNKEVLKEHINEKFECECGGSYTRANKSKHEKTKKHQNFTDLE